MASVTVLSISLCFLFVCRLVWGAELNALPEFQRPDPFGGIIAVDRNGQADGRRASILKGARGGYVSFHLVVKLPKPGNYSLDFRFADKTGKIQADLFREWFHFTASDKHYYPDALVPVRLPYRSGFPEPDNQIDQQTCQAFWVDLWIAKDARPGVYKGNVILESGRETTSLPLDLTVLPAVIPDEDVVIVDHNSYGSSWIAEQFQRAAERAGSSFFESDEFFKLIHAYHRLFYEHRGIFHQLGYGHGGKVAPEFAPRVEGTGRGKHITSWSLFERHYGPLLDGSAFSDTRRGARAIPFAYLPINPEWPASFLWWGEPGYEAEFVNVVSQMARHFREKGWTKTRFELFFNHKKRYKGFSWDGDEIRFPQDNRFLVEYGRLLSKALVPDSPVRFVFRADVSWNMEQQFRELSGIVNLWVASDSILSWYPEMPKMLRDRGDIVWYYSGPPGVSQASSTITKFPFQAWLWGVNGFVHWLAVSPGEDPWFRFDGGDTALVYSGERFGLEGPIPSIRLKLQRNCLQDLALLESFKNRRSLESLRQEAARRYNNSKPEEWWNPRPAMADLPPYEWTGAAIDQAAQRTKHMLAGLDAAAWVRVRAFVLDLASEER